MKKVIHVLYVHKSNWDELATFIPEKFREKVKWWVDNFNMPFEVIRWDEKENKLSLIDSPDWNTAKEPVVGNQYNIDYINNDIKCRHGRKTNKQIYHSKELFVQPNYEGFDVQKAFERTIEWHQIPNIKKHLSYIGNQDYWFKLLDKYGIEH